MNESVTRAANAREMFRTKARSERRHARVPLAAIVRIAGVLACVVAFAFGTARADSGPAIVVYPLTVTGSLNESDAGGRFATRVATRIAQAGGITVKPFTPGTTRTGYLSAARDLGADYYVTGFMTPIGDEVTVVSQVVSVDSGTVTWSQSAIVKTFADADAQGDAIRAAILTREGRYLAAITAPTAAPDATARPDSKANEAAISLFGRHRRHATSTPAPVAASSAGTPAATPLAAHVSPAPRAAAATTATASPAPAAVHTPALVARAGNASSGTVSPSGFGRGSAFSTYRSSITGRSTRDARLLKRFAPSGIYLASIEGDSDATHRAEAAAVLVRGLHAHAPAATLWNVGSLSLLTVRSRAQSLCDVRPGIGAIVVARLAVSRAGGRSAATQPVRVTTALTASDCRGVIIARSKATFAAIDVAAAIASSGKTASLRLGHIPL